MRRINHGGGGGAGPKPARRGPLGERKSEEKKEQSGENVWKPYELRPGTAKGPEREVQREGLRRRGQNRKIQTAKVRQKEKEKRTERKSEEGSREKEC